MIQKKTRQQLMNDLASKFDRAQQDFRARNTQLQQAAAQRPSPQIAPVRRPARASFGAQQKPVEAPVNRAPGISVGVPGTPTFREQPMAPPFMDNIRPSDMGPGSGGAPGFNPRTGNYNPFGGKVETPQGPFGISVGVPGTPTYKEKPMAPPVGKVETPQGPFGISVGVPGTPTYREQPLAPPGKVGPPQGPFGISVGVPGTPTYREQPMAPPGGKVEMPQGPLGISVGVPGTPTYREQPLTMAAKGPAPAFKKGGKVKAKATPIKKAAGGKVAAKAPVKKAVGGKVVAKPMAKPIAKKAKPMAKPMSAMKRGGKVMMKGKYK